MAHTALYLCPMCRYDMYVNALGQTVTTLVIDTRNRKLCPLNQLAACVFVLPSICGRLSAITTSGVVVTMRSLLQRNNTIHGPVLNQLENWPQPLSILTLGA